MLSAAGIVALVAMCTRLQCDPVDVAGVMASESGLSCWAHNPGGAAGLIQFEGATLKGLGWDLAADPHLNNFCKLTDVQQMEYVEKYFKPATGKLVNSAAVYAYVFLPARLHVASDPDGIICGHGMLDWAYHDNKAFDTDGKGYISVRDLTDAVNRATARLGTRWTDLVNQIRAASPCPASDPTA